MISRGFCHFVGDTYGVDWRQSVIKWAAFSFNLSRFLNKSYRLCLKITRDGFAARSYAILPSSPLNSVELRQILETPE
jgi:hypothetical protein